MFSIVSVTLMSLHVLWHAVVAFRHLPNHPRVLLEPTPSGWSWNLPEPTIKPKVNGKFADHIEVKVEFSHAVVHPAPIGFKTFTLDAAAASKTEQQQPTTVWGKARSWLERNRRPSTKFDAVTHV
ncbi:hypothetical protein FRC03_006818 [Tulasnella sp. 419]|nr:hypothetical protein FRC03_006818 [Tulasnella sp. 419]